MIRFAIDVAATLIHRFMSALYVLPKLIAKKVNTSYIDHIPSARQNNTFEY
ncbi:hypothetical protein PGTUg99_021217 [Puccinia graminis f. sp. tritici]|uniref:Uncharacterized protein n=1 Tax=Puccinia graminis f. sp. tritici TaxID=56615 RepID=A0A5B0M740_PUCGR|nr:hypothetical protein PGTUg99_021217 [Puccinia graminis f. sp. tritici]